MATGFLQHVFMRHVSMRVYVFVILLLLLFDTSWVVLMLSTLAVKAKCWLLVLGAKHVWLVADLKDRLYRSWWYRRSASGGIASQVVRRNATKWGSQR